MEWDYSAKFPLNGSFILVTSYVSYYSLLEPIAGVSGFLPYTISFRALDLADIDIYLF